MFSILQIDPHISIGYSMTRIQSSASQHSGRRRLFYRGLFQRYLWPSPELATLGLLEWGFSEDEFQNPQQDIFQPLGCLAFLASHRLRASQKKAATQKSAPHADHTHVGHRCCHSFHTASFILIQPMCYYARNCKVKEQVLPPPESA